MTAPDDLTPPHWGSEPPMDAPDLDAIEASGKRWHGEDHRIVQVRWEPYKPDGQRQMKAKGRWQEQVGSGDFWRWQNCERPSGLTRTTPLAEALTWPDFIAPPKHDNHDPRWTDPALPDFRLIWQVARDCGYAVGLHGSMKRDCDMIAAPWTDEAVIAFELIERLCAAMNARVVGPVAGKPHGRLGWNLQIDGYVKVIDISVMPRAADRAPAEALAVPEVAALEIWKLANTRDPDDPVFLAALRAALDEAEARAVKAEAERDAANALLREFAAQKSTGELTLDEYDEAAFDDAYDTFITKARAHLGAKP